MAFLNPDEVLMETPYLVLCKRNNPPKTPEEVLQGMINLWERIVEELKEDPEFLKEQERSMNIMLEEAGAWERVSLEDDSYLDLLNPLIISGDGWGIGPELYLEELNLKEVHPEIRIEPGTPEAEDPELPYDLADQLLSPLHLPREYR